MSSDAEETTEMRHTSKKPTDDPLCTGETPERFRSAATPVQRSRLVYGFAAALVIGAGLFWRSGLLPLPSFLAKYGGDSLWALVVFLVLGCVFRRSSTVRIALAAVCFAWSVEFLQLYHAPWIDAIRSTSPGQLVLGASFNAPDLIAYVIGVAIGALAEFAYLRSKKRRD